MRKPLLLTLQTYEHRRFARSRLRNARSTAMNARVRLLAPCKGIDVGLTENLRPLLEQDYPNYEVVFIVESADDPACETIRRLMAESRRAAVKLVVSGKASDTGQKVHNLRVGTDNLPADVEILAFVDSDARPHPAWLRLLVQRLDTPGAAAATGYRWFVPTRPSLAAYIQYSINACAAVMYRPDARGLVWGGSWAIRRDKFDQCGLHTAWQGTLSDDLVASRVLRKARMRVEFEPACMLPSPLELDLRQMFEFLRRQYIVGRTYALRTWCLGFAAIVSTALAFWGGLLAVGFGLVAGASWTWMPAAFCLAWYVLNVARGYLRRATAHSYFADRFPALHARLLVRHLVRPSHGIGQRSRHAVRRGRHDILHGAATLTGSFKAGGSAQFSQRGSTCHTACALIGPKRSSMSFRRSRASKTRSSHKSEIPSCM